MVASRNHLFIKTLMGTDHSLSRRRIMAVPAKIVSRMMIPPIRMPLVCSAEVSHSAGSGVGVPKSVVGVGVMPDRTGRNGLNNCDMDSLQMIMIIKAVITEKKIRFCKLIQGWNFFRISFLNASRSNFMVVLRPPFFPEFYSRFLPACFDP